MLELGIAKNRDPHAIIDSAPLMSETTMNLDINTAVQAAFYIVIFLGLLGLWIGIRAIQAGQRLLFFRKRRELIGHGWRMIFMGLLMGAVAFLLNRYAEPAIYQVFPPSPTVTQTSTVTLTPTITLTSTITQTPTITPTISITPTPFIPTDVFLKFTATVTANPNAIFSPIQFSKEVNPKNFQPVNPAAEFANPINKLYAAYSFDKMNNGAQWTAIWVRLSDNKIICIESEPWKGGTGGYGYSECQPSPDEWKPGEYWFHMFAGTTYKVTGKFIVTGTPPTSTPTLTPTLTITPTFTVTPSFTPSPPPPTWTPIPTPSPTPIPATWTPVPTLTLAPTWTMAPSSP